MQLRPVSGGIVHKVPAVYPGPVLIPRSCDVPQLLLGLCVGLLHPVGPGAHLMAAVLQFIPGPHAEPVGAALKDSRPCHKGIVLPSLDTGVPEPFPCAAITVQLLRMQVIHAYPGLGPGCVPCVGSIIAVPCPAPLGNGRRKVLGSCVINLGSCLIAIGASIDIAAQRPDLDIILPLTDPCYGIGIIYLHHAPELTTVANPISGPGTIQLCHISPGALHRIPADYPGILLVPPAFDCCQLLVRFCIDSVLRPLRPLAGFIFRLVIHIQRSRTEPEHGPFFFCPNMKLHAHITYNRRISHLTCTILTKSLPAIPSVPAYLQLESIPAICPFYSGPGRTPAIPADFRCGELYLPIGSLSPCLPGVAAL